ncbi:crotonase/enoyl-CoA hydratase family protein [Tenacibaculum sp. M341]|uniref:crotonase/enoyl-CoA hydratase family protein n=1 Tax=Tenacibaculum sp. M341 TaxID=2530339 RepID=UPI00104CC4B1|nr:crotonase/enoyl-CoA hydratase family protein [Tenacibaculum sp. M341]TCI84365.1 crotonase/enoyl-CoA hydratase family protein [Tenacibaculum sp. M341]
MNTLVQYTTADNYAIIKIENGKVNAISHEVIDALNACLDKAEAEERAVILTGQDGILSGGYDLKVMTKSLDAAKELVTRGSKLSHRLLSFPTPVIVACGGHAVAKGAFLLLSADYRIGVEGDFKIGLNEVMIGMTMHQAGIEIAKGRLAPVFFERSVNNAEMYSPKDAQTAGFLDKVVPQEHLLPTAIKVAQLFGKLNKEAHKNTKLKVRKQHLENLANAIEQDMAEELSFNQ